MRQILDNNVRFTAGMTEATKAFARSKPWRGTVTERADKFRAFHEAVAKENDLPHTLTIREDTITDESGASGGSFLAPDEIVMIGRLSVVTYLFLVGLALGYERGRAMRFAVNLFRQRFPLSFAGCRMVGGLLIR